MRDDLLFHITTKENWKRDKTDRNYKPESLETKGFIPCSDGNQLEETANRLFSDKNKILLLVIDVSTLGENVKYEEDEEVGEKFPHLYGPLNANAVIDEIEISAEKDGQFKIEFSSN